MRRSLLVCVSLFLTAAALWSQGQSQQKFKVTGRVVNALSGEPVRGAVVDLYGSSASSGMTAADGHFEMDAPAGDAFVAARRPGFTAPTQQQQRVSISSATEPLVLKLLPLGKISGRVLDVEGEPLDGIQIQCLHEIIVNGRKQWQPANNGATDETGHFAIEDVAPGAYVVGTSEAQLYFVQPKSEAARYVYPATFYPDAASRAMAQLLNVAAGEEMKVDMTLRSIRGARVSFTTVPRYPNLIGTISMNGDTFRNKIALADATGVFTFGSVAPGSWQIEVRSQQQGQESSYGELPIEVAAADIENLKVPLGKLADIAVVISGVANSQTFVQLFSKAGQMNGSQAEASGDVKIHSVAPGTYRVVVPNGGTTCITSITSGSQDLLRDELVVSEGGSVPPIHIVQSDNCPQLTIRGSNNGMAQAVITSDAMGFEPRVVGTNYTASDLSPGDYKIYAFDDVTDLEYANPDAMRDFKSQSVRLEAGQKASVQLEVNERRAR